MSEVKPCPFYGREHKLVKALQDICEHLEYSLGGKDRAIFSATYRIARNALDAYGETE